MLLGDYKEAIYWCEKSVSLWPNFWPLSTLVAAYTATGETEKAENAKAKLLKMNPKFTINSYKAMKLSTNLAKGNG